MRDLHRSPLASGHGMDDISYWHILAHLSRSLTGRRSYYLSSAHHVRKKCCNCQRCGFSEIICSQVFQSVAAHRIKCFCCFLGAARLGLLALAAFAGGADATSIVSDADGGLLSTTSLFRATASILCATTGPSAVLGAAPAALFRSAICNACHEPSVYTGQSSLINTLILGSTLQ